MRTVRICCGRPCSTFFDLNGNRSSKPHRIVHVALGAKNLDFVHHGSGLGMRLPTILSVEEKASRLRPFPGSANSFHYWCRTDKWYIMMIQHGNYVSVKGVYTGSANWIHRSRLNSDWPLSWYPDASGSVSHTRREVVNPGCLVETRQTTLVVLCMCEEIWAHQWLKLYKPHAN